MSKVKKVGPKLPKGVAIKASLERAEARKKEYQAAITSWYKMMTLGSKGIALLRRLIAEQDDIIKAIKTKKPIVKHVAYEGGLNVD